MDAPEESSRWIAAVTFVGTAALAAYALHAAWREPMVGVLGLAVAAAVLVTRWFLRRRTQRLLESGDVDGVLDRWRAAMQRVPHAETMGPLMTATAFAAYGWVERAREVLRAADRGPAWEAALEHRLFLDALLLTFEGDSSAAQDRADRLARLPMPPAAPALIERITVLRGAIGALARAFAHEGKNGDLQLLIAASDASPLVHWAMRYGAAISAVDAGDLGQASTLLAGAPEWPTQSCFSRFHREISDEITRRK